MRIAQLFEDAEDDEEHAYQRGRQFWQDLQKHYPSGGKTSWAPTFTTWPPSPAELREAEKRILQDAEWLAYYGYFGWRNWNVADKWDFGRLGKPLFNFDDVPMIGIAQGKTFPDRQWLYMDIDGNIVNERPTKYAEYYIHLPAAVAACRAVVRSRAPAIRANLPYFTGDYFVRFGKWPENERSRNWLVRGEEVYEKGVSAYNAIFSPHTGRWMLETVDHAATAGTMQELLYGDRPIYLVQGDIVGEGTDGEPVLRNVRLVKELQKKDFLVPGMFDPVKDVED